MNINLTTKDKDTIQRKVAFTNDYFRSIWQSYEEVMISRRRNYKRNHRRFQQIMENVSPNDDQQGLEGLHKINTAYDSDSSYYVAPDLLKSGSPYARLGDLDTVEDLDKFHNFKRACDQKRYNWFNAYSSVLYTTVSNYLVGTYGKGIPDGLDTYFDFKDIYRDAGQVFASLDQWWEAKGGDQAIQSYTDHQNKVLLDQEHRAYDQRAQRWMQGLTLANDFTRPSKRVIRIINCGKGDPLPEDVTYALGSGSINALLYWLTKHYDFPLKGEKDLYQDHDYQMGTSPLNTGLIDKVRIYKDDSYSFTLRSAETAQNIKEALIDMKYHFQYQDYVHQIDRLKERVKIHATDMGNNPRSFVSIHNENINLNMSDTKERNRQAIELIKKALLRFHKELDDQVDIASVRPLDQWKFPDTLEKIQAYYEGMGQAIDLFSFVPFADLSRYQGAMAHQNSEPLSDDKPYPKGFANLHNLINRFDSAVSSEEDTITYRCLGVNAGLRLALEAIPTALDKNQARKDYDNLRTISR